MQLHTVPIEITDLSSHGPGLGRLNTGEVVFIEGTLPGDLVEAELTPKKGGRFFEGQLTKLIRPSPDRQKPRCSVFGECGGCQWQHVPYELQWKSKVKGALESLKRRNVIIENVQVSEFPAQKIWNYRNRVQWRGNAKNLGYFKAKSNDIVSAESCAIANHGIVNQWKIILEQGQIKYSNALTSEYFVELEQNEGQTTVTWNQGHASLGFRQVYEEQNLALKKWMLSKIKDQSWVLDLYGGKGNFTYQDAQRFKRVDCVDVSAERIVENGFHSYVESVESWLKNQSQECFKNIQNKCAIIDPPRKGLGSRNEWIVDRLVDANVVDVFLVGCDAISWAKDLSVFLSKGFLLKEIAIFDFFPQTVHVESVAYLTKQ